MAISDTTLNEFTINYLSQSEFNNLTTKNANELYLTPDDSITSITAGSGLSGGGTSGAITLNHSNSVSEKTTQGLYPITFDAQGHITGAGSAATIPTGAASAKTKITASTTATKTTLGEAFTIPNVTDGGSGSASISGTVENSNTLVITISHTHNPATFGTAFTVPNVTDNASAKVDITDPGHTHNLS